MAKSEAFSDELRAAILNAPISRFQISKLTGIEQASLSRFVHGKGGLAVESIDRLCKCLNLHLIQTDAKNARK